jgi:hypothetical protein
VPVWLVRLSITINHGRRLFICIKDGLPNSESTTRQSEPFPEAMGFSARVTGLAVAGIERGRHFGAAGDHSGTPILPPSIRRQLMLQSEKYLSYPQNSPGDPLCAFF